MNDTTALIGQKFRAICLFKILFTGILSDPTYKCLKAIFGDLLDSWSPKITFKKDLFDTQAFMAKIAVLR